MPDLAFIPDSTTADPRPRVWLVRDGAGGRVVGSVEWHDALGRFGFAAADSEIDVFWHPEAARQVGAFLAAVNLPAVEP
jgi:hypothetical protein